ncbi:ABC-type Fe3+-hydroxamate transport system, periplasmic component [Archaeoglobus sulfaticallidus PM70-1]|uniref:ABC-type Fe3+-hydroxamate transport system, periplasmic component n=1 Tax=Archaeoglobus sulfaticallidus PM70-1 TaxID=387631 RepID=N0BKA0_9EURY|nr:cobalamin-binding protein [Archaeoglobus sulfaticallidus]AGK60926.1 ABC-type Fe3+-hydroxamate transport system, periplasmic component [Archaeoglobus sulfaticallidus PM70-1]
MRRVLFAVLFLSLFFTLCTQPVQVEKDQPTLQLNLSEIFNATPVDDTGYKIPLDNPRRIVSLAPSNTEILFAIGAEDRVVGVTDYCNYPPEVLEKKKSGVLVSVGGYSTVNVERVLALKPDLVVATYGNGLDTIEALRNFGIDVIAFDPKTIEDVMKDIILIGKATGKYDQAKEVVKEMYSKIERVRKEIAGKKKVRVAHILWHDPVWVSGKNTFISEVIELAGGENVFDFDGWRIVSIEDLLRANPDVIIVSSGSGMGGNEKNIVYEWIMSDSRLRNINAVENGRVYVVDADIISRPSYRLADAVEVIAKLLHGDNEVKK